MSQTKSLTIIIVDKGTTLKTLTVKDYKVEELYKKCGFKKADDFTLQVEWPVKLDGQRYLIQMYGKLEGKANMENKYDFPPPVDKKLYFGDPHFLPIHPALASLTANTQAAVATKAAGTPSINNPPSEIGNKAIP